MSMALELILVHNHGKGFQSDALYVQDSLELDQDYNLFAQIDKEWMGSYGKRAVQVCKPKPIPPGFKVMRLDEEDGWKHEPETCYGEELTYVLAKELCKVVQGSDWTDWNKAVFAMMKALPADFPIILWWH
jgi:hypothetical protein